MNNLINLMPWFELLILRVLNGSRISDGTFLLMNLHVFIWATGVSKASDENLKIIPHKLAKCFKWAFCINYLLYFHSVHLSGKHIALPCCAGLIRIVQIIIYDMRNAGPAGIIVKSYLKSCQRRIIYSISFLCW